jgi:hypothetical protein
LTHTERHEPALERLLGTTGRFDERPAAHVTREHERRRRAYRWLRRLLAHGAATRKRKRKEYDINPATNSIALQMEPTNQE